MDTKIIGIINVFADTAVVLSLVVILYQATIALRQYTLTRIQKQADRALERVARWNNLEFASARRHVMMYFKEIDESNYSEYATAIEKDSDLRGHAASILNFFEEIAIGVNRNVYDMDIIYEFFHPIITYYWQLLTPFVKWLRVHNSDTTIFRGTELLYKFIQKRANEEYAVPPGKYWSA